MAQSPTAPLRSWLDSSIGAMAPGNRLPAIRTLAGQFGLSHATVSKVVREYRERGLLTAYAGKGVFVGGVPYAEPDVPTTPGSSSERVAAAMEERIAAGELKHGAQLPPVKSLSAEYGVSMTTAVHAYRSLCRRKLVRKSGRSYFVGREPDGSITGRPYEAACFTPESVTPEQALTRGLLPPALRAMEEVLLQYNMPLRFHREADLPQMAARWLKTGTVPRAVVFPLMTTRYYNAHIDIIRHLQKESRPRDPSVLACGNIGRANTDKGIHVVMPGSLHTARARRVAEYVAEKGIEELVLFHDHRRSGTGVFLQLNRIWLETIALRPGVRASHVIADSEGLTVEAFMATRHEYKGTVRDNIEPLMGSKRTGTTFAGFLRSISAVRTFSEAYRSPSVGSLWVFAAAHEALPALDWCAKHKVPVPSRVSLVCLESTPECIARGLSSCVDDWQTIGYQMAHALIGDLPVERSRRGYIRLRARFLGRHTTR